MRRRYLKAVKDFINNYLTIEALEDELTVSLQYSTCLYCIDGNNKWKLLDTKKSITINSGQTISFKDALYSDSWGCGTFVVNKKFNLVGNAMSMLFGDNAKNIFDLSNYPDAFRFLFDSCSTLQSVSPNFLPAITLAKYCYMGMFYGCTSLTTAPELPATTLTLRCYTNMFQNCTSLTTAPELPVTTLEEGCYGDMFYGCTSLIVAPELPATTLARHCYSYMFYGCSKLNYIKMLATDISATNCLNTWVQGVASRGTIVKNPAMTTLPTATASNHYAGIPSGWTVINDGEE